jgi:diguanylate cyclase (GGDEF)-like protein
VARQGGDEFLILLGDVSSPASEVVASNVRTALRDPFVIDGIEISISASIGIGLYPVDGDDAAALLRHADAAMYSVKETGRDGYARDGDIARTAVARR